MPGSRSLDGLRRRIEVALTPGQALRADPWVDPVPMRRVRRDVERAFESVGAPPAQRTLQEAVRTYVRSHQAASFLHLKHVCYGVALPVLEGGKQLLDLEQLDGLLWEVDETRGEPRRFRRCYQALMQAFFALPCDSESGQPRFTEGGIRLRAFLAIRLAHAATPISDRDPPLWVGTLQHHSNLLADNPCDRYVDGLREGDVTALATACQGLGIGSDSWVWSEVILAYLRDIGSGAEARFRGSIDRALDIVDGKTALRPSDAIKRVIVATLIRDYERVSERPELPRLRDAVVERIGNPWLQRARWDAWVRHEPARQMVDGWLKSRLMEDFFTLLADQGGATDRRRLDYWLRFVPATTDMWFALGAAARRNRSAEFVEMRKRMEGRRLELEPSQGEGNNAFIMKIGGYYFVEFGLTGNACYYYREDDLPFALEQGRISIHRLKAIKRQSKNHVAEGWERDFDAEFCALHGFRPARAPGRAGGAARQAAPGTVVRVPGRQAEPHRDRPAPHRDPNAMPVADWRLARDLEYILACCDHAGIKHEDLRGRGGSLWVYANAAAHADVVQLLERHGFRFGKSRNGYYLEG